ncbi:acyl-CoA dehydrogenase [Enemella dayhoffiae]|uniref:Acyl-CoA dehydrogenase n=1 Tax=Enemella dayhoffiae TaxID=2016507 RepID=A0A255HEA4_9ACTN|nr:acyl-CoA dehydrogenase family protein [Enemella dayhoffiae]OYO24694.1 acyl-CoA dehydrogenase [Enemella dayhoffiae]
MDLTWNEQEEAFRAEAREWLAANVPRGLPSGDTREGFTAHLDWEHTLFDARWAVVSWPEEFGGRDASLWEWLIFEEEYYRAEAPQRVTQNGIFLLAPTLFEFGTPEQQQRILPRMAAAKDLWAQGWSEPGAGSDLAGVRSRAEPVDGGFRVSGQKTWSTRGAFCTHLFGLFRSDPESQRHKGLTYLMLPLDADGVEVRGFERLDGDEGFAEVFLDDVFVGSDDVIGEVGRGWQVAMATTGSERGLTLRSPGRFLQAADRLITAAQQHPELLTASLAEKIADVWSDAQAYQQFTLHQVTHIADGTQVAAESSLNKVFWSEMDVRLHQVALELLESSAVIDNSWSRGFMFSLGGTIYAGTNEIQRNIIAERVLGLPRK